MKIPYYFHPALVLRTPQFPLCQDLDEPAIRNLTDNRLFMEAIYLASPVLYDECMKWKTGVLTDTKGIQKLSRSLVKYFWRMSSRCTPFGLFSGCTVVPWGESKTQITHNHTRVKRHTRFDMHYLCALSQKLATLPGIKEHLRYFPNNSAYPVGDELRYIEYKYVGGARIHQISSVSDASYLRLILKESEKGITIDEAAALLVNDEIGSEEAAAFIDEILQAQLLTSELEPAITGEEFIYQVISVLERIWLENQNEGVREIIDILTEANRQLSQLDQHTGNAAEPYRAIQKLLDKLDIPYDESKLFQADIIIEAAQAVVSNTIQQQLLSALSLLNRMTLTRTNENLQSFIRRYYDRYEDREMPLLEVLDNESGIGYPEGKTDNHTPLVEDLLLPDKKDSEGTVRWGLVEKCLVNKVNKAIETGSFSIDLHENELTLFPGENWADLPPSLAVMFRMMDATTNTILLEHACGSSAANLLGRFAHADKAINQIVLDITAAEQKNDPEILYAEIIHLPESRVGNILLHPAFREYEIPYLAKSSLNAEHQIQLSDLVVSVKSGRIVLRSKRLNKQIIPRLSTAHNYSYNALPVYHFLCDLQMQKQRSSVSFNWGSLKYQYKFLPRVMQNNTILELASWRLLRGDYEHLMTAKEEQLPELLQAFRKEWRLPRYIVLADSDNEMLVDLESTMMVRNWLDMVKNRPGMELKEFYYPENTAVTDGQNNTYCNQFVATIIKEHATYSAPKQVQKKELPPVTADFSIGSEWLYYKFYCGVKSADKILSEAIQPAVDELLQRKAIDQFFFIRYYDPGFHIRLRLHMPDVSVIGEVIGTLSRHISQYERMGYIYKTLTDTYKRELDRYGRGTIELTEQFFYHDSEAVLKMLQHTWGDAREQIRWIWTLRSIDELLNGFGFSIGEKLSQMESMKNAFATEFNADKMLNNQLNNKYRKYRKQIEQALDPVQDDTNDLQPIMAVLKQRSEQLAPVIDKIKGRLQINEPEVTLSELLFSYIHMVVNRSVSSKPRVHELVMYDLLHQYYRSVVAREKQKTSSKIIVKAA
ncbi:hypothetical protein FAM09_23605 [Niastella caeni]|uniref:Lantibiotic dehydratase n=1 Tax=Niastella caeni TaxID=2569763 RepID=A0A4S8HIL8_9BACT|nr:lantibiotic dehydratase [Niastella caeni]THU34977.1 hypothetical protein FAM09_23605 [Niastella caeni]